MEDVNLHDFEKFYLTLSWNNNFDNLILLEFENCKLISINIWREIFIF